jgi:hypothetical protein
MVIRTKGCMNHSLDISWVEGNQYAPNMTGLVSVNYMVLCWPQSQLMQHRISTGYVM